MTESELAVWLRLRLPEDAAEFLLLVARMVRQCDDLTDNEVPASERPHVMAAIAHTMLVALPAQPFYAQWFATMSPLLATVFATWAHTDGAKASPFETTRIWGFVWRDSVDFMLYQTALLACGPVRAREIIAEWLILEHGACAESFHDWETSTDGPLRNESPQGTGLQAAG